MPSDAESQKSDLIKRAMAESRRRLGKAQHAAFQHFLKAYFENVPPQDVRDSDPKALFWLAHGHWKLGQRRIGRGATVRAYNPVRKKDGWETAHTVVEIVNDDMPFLVDSVTAELNRQELTVHLVIHPVVGVRRDGKGRMVGIVSAGSNPAEARGESFMHIRVTHQSGKRLKELERGVLAVLADVRRAVTDWRAMRGKMSALIDELDTPIKGISVESATEVREFLRWIHDNHYTFLGFREYRLGGNGKKTSLSIHRKSGLGVLRNAGVVVFKALREHGAASREVRDFIDAPELLIVSKTNRRSTVHRPVHMDAIGIRRFNSRGRVIGLRLFVGLFTSAAYSRSPRDIPLLRHRLQQTVERAGFPASSHDGKALMHILETFPRDELFQVSDDYLYETSLGILHLQDRQRVALFVRCDDFQRFMSCLIYVPRDAYTTALRLRIQDILSDAFDGEVAAHHAELGDSPLARLQVIIRTTPGKIPPYDVHELEAFLVEAARSWRDRLSAALVETYGEERGLELLDHYASAFGPGYREMYGPTETIRDIEVMDDELVDGDIGLTLYRPAGEPRSRIRFKVYHPDVAVPLSDVLPLFEHMGFRVIDETPNEADLRATGSTTVMIHDFGLESRDDADIDLDVIGADLKEAFRRVWHGATESDGFNALVICAGLNWREIVILRAYSRFLRQTGIPFSQSYMEQTLANNAKIARQIVDLFMTRFDPARDKGRETRARNIDKRIAANLEAVVSADEDRILRRFVNAVESTLRTNFFQKAADGTDKAYVSFKFDSKALEELPLPRPLREIFVYSPDVEGVHLRFGLVARGGLRWSDRPEDFRTEILGLVKAQQVKNAVIVPVGSKGGFVVKNPPPAGDREAFLNEGIRCYKLFISGLLDLTDNIRGPRIVPARQVVRHDGDDPYLVVAADKGTATFSDIANGVSLAYGHWLGDAFASGGSQGYDHKGMGITARGGWESVKRHFREMGVDIQTEDFTVIGVGDMSGDVFGNGMLLSRHIKLIGAFNHMHIFVDPDPDPAKSLDERRRLFSLPRSAWTDYKKNLISKGGGVFERSAKTVPASAEMRVLFGLDKDRVTPNELIRAMLTAPIDLLWFGGIGTYVKAENESAADVGDRANDAIRVNGENLACKVIGEGANLGCTQLGRIEYALEGGRLNTDSIDNSAGVDCSDHEVNIKILIDSVVAAGGLTMPQRNKLLARMTDEVGELVLRHNYTQTQAITMVQARGQALDHQIRLMRMLERAGRLDRSVEFLPDDETLDERQAKHLGLVRPEIAILMSYAKIWLYDELLASDLPDDPWLEEDLVEYFPTPLRTTYLKEIRQHRLRREIVATRATNSLVNRVGGTFITEFMEKTGKSAPEIARAYMIGREVFRLRDLWTAIEGLDNKVPTEAQTAMFLDIHHLLEWVTLWFLRNGQPGLDVGAHVKELRDGIAKLSDGLTGALPAHYRDDVKTRAQPYIDQGVPERLALQIANLVNLYSGCDVVMLANRRKLPVLDVARTYFAIGSRFHLGRLRAAAEQVGSDGHWQQLAVAALIEEVYGHQLALAGQVLDYADRGRNAEKAIERWADKYKSTVDPTEQLLSELWSVEINDLSMVAVASRQLRAMADANPDR